MTEQLPLYHESSLRIYHPTDPSEKKIRERGTVLFGLHPGTGLVDQKEAFVKHDELNEMNKF